MENVRNYCFICSLPSHAFEQGGDANGFARHMKREHGMWSYVYYTLHLKSIDPEEFNYHEKYLHDMLIKEKDITPFPVRAGCYGFNCCILYYCYVLFLQLGGVRARDVLPRDAFCTLSYSWLVPISAVEF
eukprot:m.1528027 g.1528027  ORF g.1528027 m.1528027 type:complete len:130 (-) comp25237_c1_seq4:1010-1399(-)